MGASINTNMPAMTAQRHLGATQGLFHRTVERLSSGLRINSARDDAAGLFLSERLKNQVRGLQQASRNAQDGVSFLQTAEGGLSVQHDILMRLRELAVQSANGIMSDADRALSIKPEADALLAELSRVSQTTQFNGTKLLDGKMGGAQVTGVGTAAGSNAALVLPDGVTVVAAASAAPVSGADLTAANGIENIQAKSAPTNPMGYTLNVAAPYAPATDSVDLVLTQEGGATQTITVNNVSTINGAKLISFNNFDVDVLVNANLATGLGGAVAMTNVGFAVSQNVALMDTDTTTAGIQSTSASRY
ncbi:MAG: Flagellin protein FlaA [uncultured Chloroflexi bacterium]|uniref:Flagellin n=1 Tax=uncultured Chloroflexota bacterium TaxID=166587 RepID=A0A6J4GYW0_9CHLR|nr:MAG: Flagellin protein FlaA [uncultured Chloroflexota bacterium]